MWVLVFTLVLITSVPSAHLEMACDAQGGEKIVFCLSYHVSVAGHVLQVTTLENKLVNISPVPGGLQ